jgi:hypothetical protein
MNKFFTVLYNSIDLSKKVKDFGTASVSLELQSSEYLYVGFDKPFKQFFIELSTKSTSGGLLTAEYFDGSIWSPLESLLDETENFTKSGFLFFEKPSTWAATTVDGEEKFFIRLATDTNHSVGTELQGLAILLSNDLDLEGVRSNIVSKHNNGASWVLKHEQARKDIIQALRNRGNRIVKNADKNNPLVEQGLRFADLTEFDLLEPEQLRQASLYLVLSMIYLDELSDNEEDKFFRQGERYERKYSENFNLFYLQIDFDDDGISDNNETVVTTSTALSWR